MKIKEIAFISSILLILSCVNEDNEKIAVDVNYRESNLPIITINTYGEEIPDEPRIDAYMGIIDNGNVVNKIDDVFNDYDGKITIEKRGNSSQDQEKPPYRFETVDGNGENPWEKTIIQDIEKAIINSELGLSPQNDVVSLPRG